MKRTRKKNKKSAPIFPPELAKQDAGKAANPQMALASPAEAASMASGFAGLGSVGSINEEIIQALPENQAETKEMREFFENLRNMIWDTFPREIP